MEGVTDLPDRRQRLRERHREAILTAAGELIRESGSVQLSTEAIAERADVARRTVFNHFASLDDVVTEVSARVIGEAVEEISAAARRVDDGEDELDGAFARMSAVFESVDLTPQLSYLWSVLGGEDTLPRRYSHLLDDAFHRLRDLLVAAAAEPGTGLDGDPEDDTLGLEVLVTSLMGGIAVVAQRWCEQTGGVADDAGRALWSELVARMTDQVGRGYRPGA